jgi:predicted PurR-regulated permease PerM
VERESTAAEQRLPSPLDRVSPEPRSGQLARMVLQLAVLGVLFGASLWIVRPFLLAGVWGAMIAIATWPLVLRLQSLLAGRRSLAVAAFALVLLLVLVIPLYFGIGAIVDTAHDVAGLSQSLTSWSVPQPPEWVETLPVVGAKVAGQWRELAAERPEELAARVTPYARDMAGWLVSQIGSIGTLLLQFLLTVLFTAILQAQGETAANGARRFARWLGGEQGEHAAQIAGGAVRAVALGVIVTALVQSALVGLGFALFGIPFAAILTALSFGLSVAQIGPAPLLIGAVIWAYMNLSGVWATMFLVWALFCATIDNIVRPVLIRRGADFPLLLIFTGVVGGLVAFGVVGLFIGPVVLGVTYTLLGEWLERSEKESGP